MSPGILWTAFFSIIALVWIYRTRVLLKTLKHMPVVKEKTGVFIDNPPLVSVIIPMKNEENNAQACIEAFRDQDYRNSELIIANDNSTDETETILKEMFVDHVLVPKTPEGWTGKNFALHTAYEKAKGEWLLFTDADTRHEPSSISSAIRHAEENNLEFLTLLPRCLTGSFLENMIQPFAMALIGLWFPIQKINSPNSSLYFANGQYILIKRELYEKIGRHEAVKGAFLEDFALMKRTKEIQAPAQCALGVKVYGTRMYDSIQSMWRGWRRIFLHAFERKPSELFAKMLETFTFSVIPFIGAFSIASSFVEIPTFLLCLSSGTLLFIIIVCWRGYKIVRANSFYAVLHPLAGFFLTLFLLDAVWIAATNRKTVWR